MDESDRRIIILGKAGAGKSSAANTIFGTKLFPEGHTSNSETRKCRAETRLVNGRSITLIDTRGFFATSIPEEERKPEIVSCITECAPGPHAFLIVLKVEKFTEQEEAVIKKIHDSFSQEVLKYATVLFTHGDQLTEGQKIEDFVHVNKVLSELVQKCGGRCHVIDNKYWNEKPSDEYRSNQFQVKKLFESIDKMVMENNGNCYTNETLEAVNRLNEEEEQLIRQSPGNMSEEEIKQQAKSSVFSKLWVKLAGISTGVLLGSLLGVVLMGAIVVKIVTSIAQEKTHGELVAGAKAIAGTRAAAAAAGTVAAGAVILSAAAGGAVGGFAGYTAAETADTPWEAAKMATEEVTSIFDKSMNVLDKLSQERLKES